MNTNALLELIDGWDVQLNIEKISKNRLRIKIIDENEVEIRFILDKNIGLELAKVILNYFDPMQLLIDKSKEVHEYNKDGEVKNEQ